MHWGCAGTERTQGRMLKVPTEEFPLEYGCFASEQGLREG